jgi:iron-sulfur cluster repair protein YtfE (RIC family)
MVPAVREPDLDDVVEVLLQAHAFARSMLALADRLTTAQADASTAGMAHRVAAYFRYHLEVHFADEAATLAPRLAGRHPVLDQAITAMRLEHLQLHALVSRVAFLSGLVAKDPQRLLSVRFELAASVEHLRRTLEAHQAREESILFPAVRRLLDWQDVEAMRAEMALRRAPGLELTDA